VKDVDIPAVEVLVGNRGSTAYATLADTQATTSRSGGTENIGLRRGYRLIAHDESYWRAIRLL
jgi:hypothetical protein